MVLAGAGTVFFAIPGSKNNPKQEFAAVLRGFEPGSKISYTVSSASGEKDISGQGEPNSTGAFKIPSTVLQSLKTGPGAYKFSVTDTKGKSENFAVSFDPVNGKINVTGDGFDPFAPIGFSETLSPFAKTDWTGNLNTAAPWTNNDNKSIQFAFLNLPNIARDAPDDPRIIEIFEAPDGGGPPMAGGGPRNDLNVFDNLYCETVGGEQLPSTCRPRTLGATTIESGPGSTPMQRASFNIMDNYVRALMMMTEQLSAVMMQHAFFIGPMLDAKMQLETQRELQKLAARAHKDYHPSKTMCEIGSFIKSVPQADQKISFNKQAMNNILMKTYANQKNLAGAEGYSIDIEARVRQFRRVYCDRFDNNNGLEFMCEHDQDQNLANGPVGAADKKRMNKDIDYARTMEFPLTLDADFANAAKTGDEEDIIALARNLYWPQALFTPPAEETGEQFRPYMSAQRIRAITNVAHNSFLTVAAMKARAEEGLGAQAGWNHMKSMMRNFGLSDTEIHSLLGDYPSYWSQMEVMTKKMVQQPDFYTHLLDTPANVKRIGVSLDAIKVMQQRDMLESRHRMEMLTSMMVEGELAPMVDKINAAATVAVKNIP